MGVYKEPCKATELPQEPGEASENLPPSPNGLVLFQIPLLLCVCTGKQALAMQQMLLSPACTLTGSPSWGPPGAEGCRLSCSQRVEDHYSGELLGCLRWTRAPRGPKAEPLAVTWQHPPSVSQRFDLCVRGGMQLQLRHNSCAPTN